MSEWDEVVDAIVARTRCTRAFAESVARGNGYTPPAQAADDRRANVLEKQEQAEVVKLFRTFGFAVYSLSQARASKQTPGIPDLWCMHRYRPVAFWWETKRQVGGRLSPPQVEFRDFAVRCGVGYCYGDRHAARSHLIKLGLAQMVNGALEPTWGPVVRASNG